MRILGKSHKIPCTEKTNNQDDILDPTEVDLSAEVMKNYQ